MKGVYYLLRAADKGVFQTLWSPGSLIMAEMEPKSNILSVATAPCSTKEN